MGVTAGDSEPDCGIVFGATGTAYRNLARRAARNVRAVMPGIAIDLYTDAPLEDAVFDRIHQLRRVDTRPKLEALRDSRFRRTVYLDCDVVMLHPIHDVFDLLEQVEIAGAHEQFGSSPVNLTPSRIPIPPAFRQINSGVLGVRRTAATTEFLERYRAEFLRRRQPLDQPLLRELLYEGTVRLAVLPSEYNLMYLPHVRVANKLMMAPRILHIPALHEVPEHAATPELPFDAAALVNPVIRDRLNDLARSDRTLGGRADARMLIGEQLRRQPWLYRILRRLRRNFS